MPAFPVPCWDGLTPLLLTAARGHRTLHTRRRLPGYSPAVASRIPYCCSICSNSTCFTSQLCTHHVMPYQLCKLCIILQLLCRLCILPYSSARFALFCNVSAFCHATLHPLHHAVRNLHPLHHAVRTLHALHHAVMTLHYAVTTLHQAVGTLHVSRCVATRHFCGYILCRTSRRQ